MWFVHIIQKRLEVFLDEKGTKISSKCLLYIIGLRWIGQLKSNNKNLYNGKLSKRDPFTLLETATT